MDGISRAEKISRSVLPRILGHLLRATVPAAPLLLAVTCDTQTEIKPSYDFQVDPENIRNLIAEISANPRRVFTDGNRRAEAYLEGKFREYLGGEAEISRPAIEIPPDYRTIFGEDYPHDRIDEIHNVIARLPGRDSSKKLVFTAHLDSMGEGLYSEVAPGANDNATGLAVLLEIARNAGRHVFPFDIEFVAFNAEEVGRLGSRSYISGLSDGGQSILGAINLDTLGNNLALDRLVVIMDKLSRKLAERLQRTNTENPSVPLLELEETACSSDECSFGTAKIPAVLISENRGPVAEENYPGYLYAHTSADTLERINADLVARAAELCLGFLKDLAADRDWERLIRPSFAGNVEFPFRFRAALGEEDLFLTLQEEESTGLKYGIFYDPQGNPRYRLELGFLDDYFGFIRNISDEALVGQVFLPFDRASGRVAEPIDLTNVDILNMVGERIGRIVINGSSDLPVDSFPPTIELLEPTGEVLAFPNKAVLVRGRTEPGLRIFPSVSFGETIEAGPDGEFGLEFRLPESLSGSLDLTVPDAPGNETTRTVTYHIPIIDQVISGISYRFYGQAQELAAADILARIAERIQLIRNASLTEVGIFIDPLQEMDFDGNSQPSFSWISVRQPLIPPALNKDFAALVTHEFFHTVYQAEADWINIYDRGKELGTWDLLDDSVLLNYYSQVGHPKETDYEGFASAGQAYVLFPDTFRRIIELLALAELPAEPFGSNESLNRVIALIWEQTPDRVALRQNLTDVYNFLRDYYLGEYEFTSDF